MGGFAVLEDGDGFQSLGWFWGAPEFQVVGLRQSGGGPGSWHGQASQAAVFTYF